MSHPTTTARPPVDVVIPFAGSDASLAGVLQMVDTIDLEPGDHVFVVDNRPGIHPNADPRVVPAPELQSSYFARNAGARRGTAPWLIFLDADVRPAADVVSAYRLGDVAPGVGLLAGKIVDDDPRGKPEDGIGARYNHARSSLGNDRSERTEFYYGKTANVAMRREAFDAIGGFRADLRSGGDAEVCFRLRDAGWDVIPCPESHVDHVGRASVRKVLRQFARYGSGARWLNDRYPGFSADPKVVRHVGGAVKLLLASIPLAIRGQREQAAFKALDGLTSLAFLVGRHISNVVE